MTPGLQMASDTVNTDEKVDGAHSVLDQIGNTPLIRLRTSAATSPTSKSTPRARVSTPVAPSKTARRSI
jgi:hypothetical protein